MLYIFLSKKIFLKFFLIRYFYSIFCLILDQILRLTRYKSYFLYNWIHNKCHYCGNIQKIKLAERVYKCSCGYVCDRDENAAKNIKQEGLRILRAS